MSGPALPVRLPLVPAHLRGPAPDERAGPAGRAAPDPVRAPYSEDAVAPGTLPLWRALRDVRDPELPVSIVDLGLVYDVRVHGGRVDVDLTFTALGCPCMDFIKQDVRDRLLREPTVAEVTIREVWDPPWTRARMTEEARATLRRLGVAA